MKRGDIYLLTRPTARDPKRQRPVVIVSRQVLINSSFSSVICALIYTEFGDLVTEVPVGIDEGLKHDSCIRCDELVSIYKSDLTHYLGSLSTEKARALNRALLIALELEDTIDSLENDNGNGSH